MDERGKGQQTDQERVRRQKLERLRKTGYPYPNDVSLTATCRDVVERALAGPTGRGGGELSMVVAGRILTARLMGKAAFVHIQDRSGRVQLYVKQDEVGERAFAEFKTYDLGDIVEAEGVPFVTKSGEPSLHVLRIRLLVKCLHPLPEKWHGLTDVEQRYRKRYLDLIVNPEIREVFRKRAKIIATIRRFFDERDYVEVETPVLTQVSGGAAARPFRTYHNSLDLDLSLRISLELPLKRLVVGGIERVYEIGRVFRNEGISTEHNPEFTMIEFYEAYAAYEQLMELTEELVVRVCDDVCGTRVIPFDGRAIDYSPPWRRLTMVDALHEVGEIPRSLNLDTIEGVHRAAASVGLQHVREIGEYGEALYELFDRHVESRLIEPTFITRFPLSVSPLSRPSTDDPRFADRFELFVAGMELANGFSELNDPYDQEERFKAQLALKQAGHEEAMDFDSDFIRALEYGLPPTAGEGIGIDRLVMLMTGASSIRDVILFPQMRPIEGEMS